MSRLSRAPQFQLQVARGKASRRSRMRPLTSRGKYLDLLNLLRYIPIAQACFTAVYGPPPAQSRSAVPRKSNLGVCGVCRRPMKIGDGDNTKTNSQCFCQSAHTSNSFHFRP